MADEEVRQVPLEYQTIMIHRIEEILEESNYGISTTDV